MISTTNNTASSFDQPDMASEHESPPNTTTAVVGSLRCVSTNVWKTAENHSLLLERHCDADIIFVQEPFKGFIKVVASTTLPDGEKYYHTSAHRNFLCLGYTENTRVLTYVNTLWRSASPQLRTSIVKHNDVICITLRLLNTREDISFINVYNDTKRLMRSRIF